MEQRPTPQQQLFVATAITLTWQLFVVVLLPFLGGQWLDNKQDSAPLFTLIGLGIALALAALVTYRAYQVLNKDNKKPLSGTKHD